MNFRTACVLFALLCSVAALQPLVRDTKGSHYLSREGETYRRNTKLLGSPSGKTSRIQPRRPEPVPRPAGPVYIPPVKPPTVPKYDPPYKPPNTNSNPKSPPKSDPGTNPYDFLSGHGGSPGSGGSNGAPDFLPNDLPKRADSNTPDPQFTTHDDDEQFKLIPQQHGVTEALFESFEGPTAPFFSKMYDIFVSLEPSVYKSNPYERAVGEQTYFPFKESVPPPSGSPLSFVRTIADPTSGTITSASVFNPAQPTAICDAWLSLVNYCNGSSRCACYSSTYYVPEQWNSLAANCARVTSAPACSQSTDKPYWCSVGTVAQRHTLGCNGLEDSRKIVKFGVSYGRGNTVTTSPTSVFTTTPTSRFAALSTPTMGFSSSSSRLLGPDHLSVQLGLFVLLISIYWYV